MSSDALPADRSEPALHRSRVPAGICGAFRTKTLYLSVIERDLLEEDPRCHTAAFWCLRTHAPVGPDNAEVAPESCQSGRTCWAV